MFLYVLYLSNNCNVIYEMEYIKLNSLYNGYFNMETIFLFLL